MLSAKKAVPQPLFPLSIDPEDESYDDGDLSDMEPLEDASNVEGDEPAPQGLIFTLVERCPLSLQVKDDDVQCENFFHTRCIIDNKLCNMIIDGGSYTNIVNASLIDKLGLKITKYSRLYKL